jgi:hypothetical protein
MQFYLKNNVFSDFYVNRYGKLSVYGVVFVNSRRVGGAYWTLGPLSLSK